MTRRPLIGLTGRRKKGSDIVANLPILSDFNIDLFYADYAKAILEAGGLPVHLPLDADPSVFAGHLDALLLTGGADIGPEHYGALSETDKYPPEPARDAFELSMMDVAIKNRTPLLGICRGLQMINVHAGGSLHQDVPTHANFDAPPQAETHKVTMAEGSTLRALYGSDKNVNSLHHQTVDVLGAELRVTGTADDGTVEGLEHESLPMIAVQWHPEMMAGRSSDPVFTWLVDQASANSAR